MRLYLSSFRMGDHTEQLLTLTGGPCSVAVIANAMDAKADDERRAAVEREFAALQALGMRPMELDLRQYMDRPGTNVAAELARYDMVWIRGGNVFVLRRALELSGADAALTEMLRADSLVYAGYSAGPCVLAPSLRGLDHCDDPSEVEHAYGVPAIWHGLGVLDIAFVPHVDSPGHPETVALDEVAARYRAEGAAHRTLRDGEVLVMDGDDVRLC